MAMSKDLLLAILAMDSYNRTGPRETPVGLSLPDGTLIGNATVLSGAGGVLEDRDSGFFGQAYSLGGQKVISYRGTDTSTNGELAKDIFNGWRVGGGSISSAQEALAAKFFQQVVGNGSTNGLTLNDLYSADVTPTGHSLGGGLAGFVRISNDDVRNVGYQTDMDGWNQIA
jgi:hypothetical protein